MDSYNVIIGAITDCFLRQDAARFPARDWEELSDEQADNVCRLACRLEIIINVDGNDQLVCWPADQLVTVKELLAPQ